MAAPAAIPGEDIPRDRTNGTDPEDREEVTLVRAEEALIVLLVLLLWVAAIALFFNRWGKIRMLEPYQPKFQQQHRASCPMIDIAVPLQVEVPCNQLVCSAPCLGTPCTSWHRSYSKFNVNCPSVGGLGVEMCRPRQNSVFVAGSGTMVALPLEPPRRTKSAMDIHTLVLAECPHQAPSCGRLDSLRVTNV